MNIMDKEKLYAEIHRVLRPNGLFVTQEPMAGPNQPLIFPVMWSLDGAGHFLRTPEEMRTLIESTGFQTLKWDDVTLEKTVPSTAGTPTIQSIVMGDDLLAEIRIADKRNDEEGRIVMIQAVFGRL